jgi:hypothetical protein
MARTYTAPRIDEYLHNRLMPDTAQATPMVPTSAQSS